MALQGLGLMRAGSYSQALYELFDTGTREPELRKGLLEAIGLMEAERRAALALVDEPVQAVAAEAAGSAEPARRRRRRRG